MAFEGSIGNLFVELGLKGQQKLESGLRSAESRFSSAEGKLGGLAGKAGHVGTSFLKMGAIVGGLGVATVGAFAASTTKDMENVQRVNAQTAAAIKSTGGQAHVTSGDIEKLTASLEDHSTTEQETIKEGANLLLTFTAIQNKAGKGNDIFNQATSVLTDMSTALGQDMKSSAIQVGKALNDPIKGVTALRRVGVSFTEDQQKQIKAMVASGNQMGAQKLILGELNKEFGGSAQAASNTFAGAMFHVKDAVGDAGRQVLGTLLPTIQAILPVVKEVLVGLVQAVGPAVKIIVQALGPALKALLPIVAPIARIFATVLSAILKALAPIIRALGPIIGRMAAALGDVLVSLVPLLAPLGQILVMLAPLISQFAVLAGGLIKQLVPVLMTLLSAVMPILPPLIQLAQQILPLLAQLLGLVAGVAAKVLIPVVRALAVPIKVLVGWIATLIQWLFGAETNIKNILGRIANTWNTVWGGIKSFFGGIWNGIKAIAADAINWLIRNVINKIIGGINGVIHGINIINPFHDIPYLKKMAEISFGAAPAVGGGLEKLPGGKMMAFGMGGVVPGRVGAPMVAIVHGGEEINPPGKKSGVVLNINGDTKSPREIVRAVEWSRRAQGW